MGGRSVTESVIHIARGQPGSGSARGSQRQRSAGRENKLPEVIQFA